MNVRMGVARWTASVAIVAAAFANIASAADKKWRVPKTEYGHPDLQGYWDFGSSTPLQRPTDLGEQRVYTEAEAMAVRAKIRENNRKREAPVDLSQGAPKAGDFIGQEADVVATVSRDELTTINGEYRTSLIIDPPNGRLPLRPGFVDFHGQRVARGIGAYDGPDTMDPNARCLQYGLASPALVPIPWNSNLQIVQSRDYVMIMSEMIHDARIVRLSDTHVGHEIRFWGGDSIGHWDGDTLVVRTVNFRPEQSVGFGMRISDEFELTERLTRIGKDGILYAYTVVDPKAYTAPFTVETVLKRLQPGQQIYEFACHEGNYSMRWMLTGARKQDADALNAK